MTKSNDSFEQFPLLHEEAVSDIRATAEQMRKLGNISSQYAQEWHEDQLADKVAAATNVQAEQNYQLTIEAEQAKREAEATTTFEAVASFADALPKTTKEFKSKSRWEGRGRELGTKHFEATDLAELRLIEATVWWRPSKLLRDRSMGTDNSDVNMESLLAYYKYPESDVSDAVPLYVIGERVVKTEADKSDGVVELLLASAMFDTTEVGLFTAKTSSVTRDRIEELSLERLVTPVTSGEAEARYNAVFDDGDNPQVHYRLNESAPRILNTSVFGPKLIGLPADEAKADAFLAKLDESLMERGARSSDLKQIAMTPEVFRDFDVAAGTLRLATLFNLEDQHAAMLQAVKPVFES
ncbi:MAG: hypothetical protein QFB87_02040 [Patescibacteria group bacterium]|nr:hypothetical protein [Patescibacteria group bacterium]